MKKIQVKKMKMISSTLLKMLRLLRNLLGNNLKLASQMVIVEAKITLFRVQQVLVTAKLR